MSLNNTNSQCELTVYLTLHEIFVPDLVQRSIMRDYVPGYWKSLAVISGLRVEYLPLNLYVTVLLLSFQTQPLLALPTYRRACLKATWWAMTIRFTSSSARQERSLISLTTPLCHALLVCARWVMPEGKDHAKILFFLLLNYFKPGGVCQCQVSAYIYVFLLNSAYILLGKINCERRY